MAEAEDKDSKTEEASEKKIADALEKGNVPFSREATLFASLLGVLAALAFLVAGPVATLVGELAHLLDDPGGFRVASGEDAVAVLWGALAGAGRFLLPIVLVLMLAGIIAAGFQNPPALVLERIRPQFSRISPAAGFKRIFGTQGHVEFGKSLFKFLAVGLVAGLVLLAQEHELVNAMFTDPLLLPRAVLRLAVRLVAIVCAVTICLVGADLVWSRISWRRDLRMSRQEMKDEFKQAEGDPMVKGRIRALARQRARQRMMNAVPKATLVLANPTHYAVALHYDRLQGGAPRVVAKGADLVALKIREIAERAGVPVIEDAPLARALYAAVEIDQWIPEDFYRPVARILHYIYSRQGRGAK